MTKLIFQAVGFAFKRSQMYMNPRKVIASVCFDMPLRLSMKS